MLMNEQKDSERVLLLAQARECFGKVAWSHQTHECQANLCRIYHCCWLGVRIGLAGFVSVLAIIESLVDTTWMLWCMAVVSGAHMIADLVFRIVNYFGASLRHRDTATDLWRIREKYQSIINALKSEHANIDIERERMEAIADELKAIYANAPRTQDLAYKQATKRLHSEACTCTDEEIDRLLPPKLRGCL